MTGRPSKHGREDSSSNNGHHRPSQPSSLRHSHAAPSRESSQDSGPAFRNAAVPVDADAIARPAVDDESAPLLPAATDSHRRRRSTVHPGVCEHGTFSPRPVSPDDGFPFPRSGGGSRHGAGHVETPDLFDSPASQPSPDAGWKQWFHGRMRTKKMGQSRELAQLAGFRDTPLM